MEMTYAALAKSLGITLKPTSSPTPTPTTASAPSSALTTNSTSLQISKSTTQTQSPEDATVAIETDDAQRIDEQDESQVEVETKKDETPSEEIQQLLLSPPQPPSEATGNESQVKPVAENKAEVQDDLQEGLGWEDAEGDTDSDIASSRPASPESPTVQASSQNDNENIESHINIIMTGSNSPCEGTDMDVDAKSQPEGPPNPTPIDSSPTPQAPAHPTKKLTDEQLHHAKVLVLDLLGWGVPPSYLLQRGISHALLYTVFTDLRLRLPEDIIADCVKLVSAQS